MLSYYWLLCLLFSCSICSEPLDCSNTGKSKTTMTRLKTDLLCGYDKYVRPVPHHSNKTVVGLIIAPRTINFDDVKSTLRLNVWLSMHWQDHHLTWDKLQYDKIQQINLDTSMVWVPDISVYNTQSEMSLDQEVAPVVVDNLGEVYTFMSPLIAGHCVPNWANWPYDIHKCSVTLGSKQYLGSTVDYRFINDRKGLIMKYILPNKDWEVLASNTTRNETKFANETMFLVSLNFDFTLRRHASVYIASYLIPGVVMVIMSLGVLWLPSQQVERTAILCTLVILQSLFLQYLAYKIPSNGDKTPYLVCFYRDCLALTGLLIVQTIVTRSMIAWNCKPTYLQSTFQLVGSNRVLQYIFMRDMDPKNAAKLMEAGNDEGSTLVVTEDNTRQWQMFVDIVNKLSFILLLPIYLLLSVSLLPLNYSFSVN